MKNWSKVLDIIQEIKYKLIEQNIEIKYEQVDGNTCVENWVKQLNDPTYNQMFANIQTSQKDNLVLVRYGRYSSVFGGESEVDYGTFWGLYDGFYRQCRSNVFDVINEVVVIAAWVNYQRINPLASGTICS